MSNHSRQTIDQRTPVALSGNDGNMGTAVLAGFLAGSALTFGAAGILSGNPDYEFFALGASLLVKAGQDCYDRRQALQIATGRKAVGVMDPASRKCLAHNIQVNRSKLWVGGLVMVGAGLALGGAGLGGAWWALPAAWAAKNWFFNNRNMKKVIKTEQCEYKPRFKLG